ncbi:MAG: hypothetical protein KBD53_08795 [Candidatus Omnitrophica bacterium]|nr:hypothetical protein [Candidatus Omnitrophota bacterium]
MGLSILVAKILSITYISGGIGALSGRLNYGKMVEEFEKSSALTFVTGFITLVLGMILVQYHNIWTGNWTVLITIVGWMGTLKGIMLMAFPQLIQSCKNCYKNQQVWGIVKISLGLMFAYFGFIH